MRLHRQDEGGDSWLLSPGERELLLTLVSRTPPPRLPAQLSRTSASLDDQARNELVGELEGHREQTRGHLVKLLRGAVEIPGAAAKPHGTESDGDEAPETTSAAWLLRLTTDDREAFLQVLNELRLAAWEQLGRPDPPEIPDNLSPTSPEILHWWTLEVASRFQGRILAEAFPE